MALKTDILSLLCMTFSLDICSCFFTVTQYFTVKICFLFYFLLFSSINFIKCYTTIPTLSNILITSFKIHILSLIFLIHFIYSPLKEIIYYRQIYCLFHSLCSKGNFFLDLKQKKDP